MWTQMVGRCTRPTHQSWHRYGGRGITVCDRWRDFAAFIEDVGDRPGGKYPSGYPEYTLDRIDNDGNYCPENCKWSTVVDQQANKQSCWTARDEYKIALETIIVECPGVAADIAREVLERVPVIDR
jgi:hypothetical protein